MVYASRYLRLLNPKMEGPDIVALQESLKDIGIYNENADGIYDEKTYKAVLTFQKWLGINADGIVGPETWRQLNLTPKYSVTSKQKNGLPTINIDVVKKKLTFITIDKKIKNYPIAVGKTSTPTPIGHWTIVQKLLNPGGPFGVRWMRLSVPWGGYGIHGTNNPNSIGTAASHGCIRMYNEDVVEVYDMTPLGTLVNIYGETFTSRVLKFGSKGSDVKHLQTLLKQLGYFKSSIDGVFGKKTEQSVIKFQQDKNLIVDGIVGTMTKEVLQKYIDINNKDIMP